MPSLKPMTSIDWTALHARLAQVQLTLESLAASPEERVATLKRRSQNLAAQNAAGARDRPSLSVVEFFLAPESYAVPTESVKGVAALREYSPIPNAPAFLIGVTSLRGRMLTIVDLRRFFGLSSPGITDLNRIVVVAYRELEVGLLADRIDAVSTLFLDELREPLPAMSGERATFCRAIAPGQRSVLDVTRLLAQGGLLDPTRMNAAPRAAEATS